MAKSDGLRVDWATIPQDPVGVNAWARPHLPGDGTSGSMVANPPVEPMRAAEST